MFWRGVWGYLPANIVQGVVGFLAIVLFTRMLSAEEFGRYALAFSVMTLAHVAVFSWLEAAMARFWAAQSPGAETWGHFASLYRTAFALSAGFLVVAGVAVWLFPVDPLFRLALAAGLAGAPARCLVKLGQERFRAAGEVGKAAWLDMAVAVGGLAIGVGFAMIGAGGAAPLLGLGLAPLAALPFVLPGELRQARGGAFEPARVRDYALYGYPIAASLALTVVLSSTDRFLLALFMDEAAVGAYHASYSIANRTLDVLFLWLGSAGQPALVMALERGGLERLREAAREQLSTFLLIGLPAAAGVALVARPLAELLIGEDLRAAAAGVTPWIALSALLFGLTAYYFGQAFTLGKKTKRLLIAMAIPAGANVVLNLILVPRFGLMGAAWATAASFGLGLIATMLIGRRVVALPIPWESLVRCGVATGVMALVVSRLPALGGFPELMLDASVGGLVYAAAALTLNAAGVRDVAARLLAQARARRATA
ncbi:MULTISPECIES: lipopolysaccharide biosynthesis protein [unclassified Brevundimonas]|uniref:lipopolysaccharide biosynthesis protein n=1 Tax=unclassified Brevundimonas TaxID=2622653 RepID=UPI0006FC4B8D|nr:MULTISPECIES: lipopolysaccharide biosynthesis protein [unclassified Brevundimonas]KQY86635.1 polysaccharide biosynthesis protein [Brevundimonas sp. Root1423]KRA19363.1 polysaccharide biosynthesis protein [Brevundimonas sp. Root608]